MRPNPFPHVPLLAVLLGAAGATPALAVPGTLRVEIRSIAPNGAFGMVPHVVQVAGFAQLTLAEVYSVGKRDFLFVGSGISGDFKVLELSAAGTSLGVVQTGSIEGTGWRAVAAGRTGDQVRLHFMMPRGGVVRSYSVGEDGALDLGQSDYAVADVEETNVLDVVSWNNYEQLVAVDTFRGRLAVTELSPMVAPVAEDALSAGWTNLDHVELDGAGFRLLYKEAGDPFLPLDPASPEEGRAWIGAIGADGLAIATVYDQTLLPGFTSARFVQLSNSTYGFLVYRPDGFTVLRSFNPFMSGGTGSVLNQTSTAPNYDEVLTYRRDGATYMIGVQLDQNQNPAFRLSQEQMGRLAQCVHDNLEGRAVGYQLSVLQHGRQLLSRASGARRLLPSVLPMGRSSKQNMGSVGKLMTTISTLALADDGWVDLYAPIAPQLDPSRYPAAALDPWVSTRTPLDLMAQVSGHTRADAPGCVESPNDDLTVDCTAFFSEAPAAADQCIPGPAAGQFSCVREYVNAHFTTLRQIIEAQTGLETSEQIDGFTRVRWLDEVLPNGAPSCLAEMDVKLFGLCKEGQACGASGGTMFYQEEQDRVNGWSRNCATGGWASSADSMVAVLEALAGGQILSPENTSLMQSTGFIDGAGGATAVGFGPAYASRSGGANVLGKDGAGGDQAGMTAFVTNLDGDGHGALFVNSRAGAPDAEALFVKAFSHATGAQPECDRMLTFASRQEVLTGHDAGEIAIEAMGSYRFVTAIQNGDGDLQLTSWERVGTSVSEDHQLVDGPGDKITIASIDGDRLIAARRNGSGNLELTVVRMGITGTLAKRDSVIAGGVQAIALVELDGVTADFATVLRDANGRLKVIVWDVNVSDKLVRLGEYTSAGQAKEVAVTGSGLNGRIMVAIRTSDGKVKPIAFQISNDGWVVERLGSAANADLENARDIRITHVQSEGLQSYFVTTQRDADDNLRLIVWTTSPDGMTVTKQATKTAGAVSELGLVPRSGRSPFLFVPLIDAEGQARLFGYSIRAGGSSIVTEELASAVDAGSDVASLSWPGLDHQWTTTAYINGAGKVRVINWEGLTGAP